MEQEEGWVRGALAGDHEAFARLVEAYQAPVYNLAYRMLGKAADAEDAAQETFLRVYSRLRGYDPARKFSSWLLSIAAHYCIDRLRRRRYLNLSLEELPPWRQVALGRSPEDVGPKAQGDRRARPSVWRGHPLMGGKMHPVENEELLSRYLEGGLSAEEKEVLKGHLEGCTRCREELRALEEVEVLFSGAPLLLPRPGFTERVMARLAQREASRRVWKAMPALMGASLFLAIFASLPLIEFGDQIWVALTEFPLLLSLGMNLTGELLASG